MKTSGSLTVIAAMLAAVLSAAAAADAVPSRPVAERSQAVPVPDLEKANRKNPLPDGGWFTWEWTTSPKMGTAILRVELFAKDGTRSTALDITGDSGMPSMPGAHDSGPVAFKLNKKGDYLLPVNIVMPGDWQVVLELKRGDEVVLRGRIRFDV